MSIYSDNKILVNFRVDRDILKSFDGSCLILNRTRTQSLNELMKRQILRVAESAASEARTLDESCKSILDAIKRPDPQNGTKRPEAWSSAVYARLKPFSSFDQVGG